MTDQDHDATDVVELAQPLRPSPAPDQVASDAGPTPAMPASPVASSSTRTGGPSRLRVGVVSGAAVALAVGAVATSFAATPTTPAATGSTGTAPSMITALGQLPAALDPALDPGDEDLDLGRRLGGIFRDITITAISGSSVTLKTEDGWTRTITVTDSTKLTKGGQDIELSDLSVGDQVRLRQQRNDDGTYTVTALGVVVPRVSGTVSDLTGTSFKVTTRDGSVWTVTTNGSTEYRFGAADGTRADIANGDRVLVLGESTGDNALTATSVAVAGDRVAGTVTAKTADSITIKTRDGSTVTVHVSSDTTYRLPGVDDPGLDDVTVDMGIVVSGRKRSDGSIDAAVVAGGRFGGRGAHGVGPGRGGWGMPDGATPDLDG